ncbi:proline-rich proteoglycan 2-like [Mizuhopecten yessoensis]|uniref:Protein SPEC3 n=1 Tax=Mizuhopecten yessoensis TaxID=6573 RepID=A0A210R3Z1_MIZYE|nr:proline-rich proteoglycan 2-like [Mizuhopecten yessoensis]OWF55708.1 Protein SPEC3 [Mizuhopecten yessoensis]
MGVGSGDGNLRARGKKKRIYIPALPMPLATLCCVLNFVVPGLGTIVAGICVCCCSRNEDMGGGEQCGSCTLSILLGLLQLILTALIIGWVWSCVWGVMMIGMSSEYYHDNPAHGDTATYPVNPQQQVIPGNQYGTPGQSGVPPNQTYPYQPAPVGYQQGQQPPYSQPQPYQPPAQPYQPPAQPYQPPAQPYQQPGQPYQPPVGFPPPEPNPKMAPQAPPQAPPYSEHRVEPSAPMEPPPPYSPT